MAHHGRLATGKHGPRPVGCLLRFQPPTARCALLACPSARRPRPHQNPFPTTSDGQKRQLPVGR